MTVEVTRETFRKPFKVSLGIGAVGFTISAIGFQSSFGAGMIGATISISGLVGAAMVNALYEKAYNEKIYENVFEVENAVEAKEK